MKKLNDKLKKKKKKIKWRTKNLHDAWNICHTHYPLMSKPKTQPRWAEKINNISI